MGHPRTSGAERAGHGADPPNGATPQPVLGFSLISLCVPRKVGTISDSAALPLPESPSHPARPLGEVGPRREASRKVRVVLVAGAGRSGSTLLTLMLGSLPDAFGAGELRYLWARGLVEKRLCGCGRPVPECPVWAKILANAFTDLGPTDIRRAVEAVDWLGGASNLPTILRRGERGRFPELGDLPTRFSQLYRAVADVTGATTIIDSSKPPTYGWLLGTLPDIDLSVIHLVRDPRGTAYSWLRPKAARDRPTGGLMNRAPPWKSALSWDLWNTMTELLFRNRPERLLRIRYEDLVTRPDTTFPAILRFLGYPEDALPSLQGQRFAPTPSHTVAGNPSRLANESVRLELDTAWQAGMPTSTRRVVTALSSPLLFHYGYPLRHSSDTAGAGRGDPPGASAAASAPRGRPSPGPLTRRS